jgi:tetratricopeptide (TPR) repeat protein
MMDVKKVSVLVLLCLSSLSMFGQGEGFSQNMISLLKKYRMSVSVNDFQVVAGDFERLAQNYIDMWPPLYYASFSYVRMTMLTSDNNKVDQYLDEAQKQIDKALSIFTDQSELYALQAFIYLGRVKVAPDSRWPVYEKKILRALDLALEFNPSNPRAHYLKGFYCLLSPDERATGTGTACEHLRKARALFNDFIPESAFSPTWGGDENLKLLEMNCGGAK